MQARCNQQSLFGQPVYCFPDLSYFDGVGALAGLKIEREEFWNQFDERHARITKMLLLMLVVGGEYEKFYQLENNRKFDDLECKK